MSHSDMSTGARARRRAKRGRDYVEMPIGLTVAIAIALLCGIGTGAIITKAVGLW